MSTLTLTAPMVVSADLAIDNLIVTKDAIMPTYQITCDGPGPHTPASGVLGSIERANPPGVGEFRCGGANCRPAAQTTQQVANSTQDAATANLLAGAAALLVRLTNLQTDITNANATYTTARTTYQSAVTALPASPTVAQIATFIKGAQATYLLADNAALVTIGTDLSATITELANTVKGLANDIARRSGSTATF